MHHQNPVSFTSFALASQAPSPPPGMAVYPPGTPRAFRTFDDALSASPHLRVLRAMLRVGQPTSVTQLCSKAQTKVRLVLCCSKTPLSWHQEVAWLLQACAGIFSCNLSEMASTMQRVPSSYPCPVEDSNTNCTLFAVTDASWEALASFLGMSVSRFGQSPVVPTVCTLLFATWKHVLKSFVGVL